jgi:hypothetical protein
VVHAAPGRAKIEIIDGDDQVGPRRVLGLDGQICGPEPDHDDCKPVFDCCRTAAMAVASYRQKTTGLGTSPST